MRKALSVTVILLFAIVFAGCTSSDNSEKESDKVQLSVEEELAAGKLASQILTLETRTLLMRATSKRKEVILAEKRKHQNYAETLKKGKKRFSLFKGTLQGLARIPMVNAFLQLGLKLDVVKYKRVIEKGEHKGKEDEVRIVLGLYSDDTINLSCKFAEGVSWAFSFPNWLFYDIAVERADLSHEAVSKLVRQQLEEDNYEASAHLNQYFHRVE